MNLCEKQMKEDYKMIIFLLIVVYVIIVISIYTKFSTDILLLKSDYDLMLQTKEKEIESLKKQISHFQKLLKEVDV